MRLGMVMGCDGRRIALWTDERWIDLTGAYEAFRAHDETPCGHPLRSINHLLCSGKMCGSFLRELVSHIKESGDIEAHAIDEPQSFLRPLRPGKIVALGRNYLAHAKESGHDAPTEPIIFGKATTSCIGPEEPIVVREDYGRVDHEAELALVIGRDARDVSAQDARDYVAGYTIMNDVTARDMQGKDIGLGHPWFRSKSLDTFGPMGPVVALPDELPWPVEVDIELRVNGETRQAANTSSFIFGIPEIIEFITRFMTLEVGDIVSTGTPEGISPIFPGDTVEITIQGIGTLRNPVVQG